jgi:hypothetical protein
LQCTVQEIYLEEYSAFNDLSLSHTTIMQHVKDIHQLRNKTNEFESSCLALDDSYETINSAQLLTVIRGKIESFDVFAEQADLKSLQGRTTGENLFSSMCETMMELDATDKTKVDDNRQGSKYH